MFATPVPGYLHPMGWQRPAGNLEFVVTRGCKEHIATGVGCALDIGNARTGAPVYAMAAGKVTSRYVQNTPGQVGHGALIMRVTHADGWSSGYAHLQSFSVALGALVKKGQQVGVLGATGYGISGPHLHTDVKLNGVARDLWPLLDQNQETDMNITITNYPGRRDCSTKGGTLVGYRLNPAPLTKSGSFGAGSGFHSDAEYVASPTPAGWPPGPYQRVVDGFYQGYLVANSQINLGPVPVPPSGGFTQEDLDKARAEGSAAMDALWEAWNTEAQGKKP